ncbi:MAG: alpha/beta fold hydrolase [Chloroflexi bacterium]|nr:alpha/beta fold hydrolase [Chloroflexota bacterium]
MPKITANAIQIEYDLSGRGPFLALIAGLGYDRWMWHKMLPGLAGHFRVLTFDNRGVGGTDKPPGPYSAQMLAADAVALMDALGVEHAHIMGHSMGGFVAQALALDYPDRVDKLILAATNFGGPRHIPITPEAMAVLADTTSPPLERLWRGVEISCRPGFADEHPEIVEEWLRYRAEHPIDPAAYQAQMAVGLSLLSEEACFEHRLKNVQAETLILFGEEDRVTPPGNAALLAQAIPNSRVVILPNAGHFFPFDAADEAVNAVIEFLS